ncbi:hypothetical protein B0T26DRAFT_755206 [Lasiosphaeria miniovina]|uniref:Uncharacterized protein n=1 Tax=Lasiosphaeria miniovina TaxID=1954250 RepID=A0AA40DND0_9PEZI|nr:uncharacterized protein B0T26DRAFT_755206 [Lasiosphaeria miniovina]KAK0710089.1 hypothetical protein B0T26DRAFT_755206 [Lasiosphaeria miniovina]
MPAALEIRGRGPITTFESASKEEFNRQKKSIEALTRQHLGLGKHDACTVLERHKWTRGGFNICVLVDVKSGRQSSKVVFRCAMPHKLAEARYPGTVDEKLGCEVGAYVWMQEKCPDIRIPRLYGFGFLDGRHCTWFTHASRRPFLFRIARVFWRSSTACSDIHSPSDAARRERLFRGMSKIMLSLARLPQLQIGAFQFASDENDGAPRTMQREDTFKCTDALASGILTFHDRRFLGQPNAIYSANDCRSQMAVKTLLRVFSHRCLTILVREEEVIQKKLVDREKYDAELKRIFGE